MTTRSDEIHRRRVAKERKLAILVEHRGDKEAIARAVRELKEEGDRGRQRGNPQRRRYIDQTHHSEPGSNFLGHEVPCGRLPKPKPRSTGSTSRAHPLGQRQEEEFEHPLEGRYRKVNVSPFTTPDDAPPAGKTHPQRNEESSPNKGKEDGKRDRSERRRPPRFPKPKHSSASPTISNALSSCEASSHPMNTVHTREHDTACSIAHPTTPTPSGTIEPQGAEVGTWMGSRCPTPIPTQPIAIHGDEGNSRAVESKEGDTAMGLATPTYPPTFPCSRPHSMASCRSGSSLASAAVESTTSSGRFTRGPFASKQPWWVALRQPDSFTQTDPGFTDAPNRVRHGDAWYLQTRQGGKHMRRGRKLEEREYTKEGLALLSFAGKPQ